MADDTKSKVISFIAGDLFVFTYVHLNGVIYHIGEFAMKVLATIILGAAGGIAGMLGKDAYSWWKKRRKLKT